MIAHRGIVTGRLLPPIVCQPWGWPGLNDRSSEFGACHTVCISSYHARITRWFNEYCTIMFVLYLFFFQQSNDLETQVSLCCYISVRSVVHCHPVPVTFDISLASCLARILRKWFCFTLFICTSATYCIPLVSTTIIANIKQHNSVVNNTKSTYSITRVEEHKCYHCLKICS